ncbi:hypothetical protein BC628DRAFT_1414846 [Trametes gibbosa]|nr:hypothetical protein BC628DRAFT_1414846 [Trametes gibbosa]
MPSDDERDLPAAIAMVGWVLKDVYSFRSADKYGQVTREQHKSYRQSIWQAPELTREPSALTRFVVRCLIHGPFFGIPQTYLEHVKSASEFRGHLAGLKQSWEAYTLQLVREYSDFILIATVLLSATVGLLTINDIGEACRVAAMLSAFAALGSMTIGVFFVWRHQRNTRMPSSFSYLHNARNNALGLSGHALLLSLPPVLLVWSIVGFTAATLAYAMQDAARASTWRTAGDDNADYAKDGDDDTDDDTDDDDDNDTDDDDDNDTDDDDDDDDDDDNNDNDDNDNDDNADDDNADDDNSHSAHVPYSRRVHES